MERLLDFKIRRQPDNASCGPTCLHGLYQHFHDNIPLEQLIEEIETLETGGTLAVFLALHALKRGYRATIYNYNLELFDPSWFSTSGVDISQKLLKQARAKSSARLHRATRAYLEFLRLGGVIRSETLKPHLFQQYFSRSLPILAGLSATFLYNESRVRLWDDQDDDVRGVACGHFVVLCGYDKEEQHVIIADPLHKASGHYGGRYSVDVFRLICAILLGVLSYDANFLVLEPNEQNS
jgi:hypothetical protein